MALYVSPSVAITLLEEQLGSLKNQLAFYNSSSQEYKIAYAKYSFFSAILKPLQEGKTVKQAIEAGLQSFGSSDMSTVLPKGKKEEFKQEVIDLLKL
jgi:hypothetical protein